MNETDGYRVSENSYVISLLHMHKPKEARQTVDHNTSTSAVDTPSASSNMASMQRWAGRVALVTGASAGIGEAIAKMLADSGMKVVACARRMEKLEALSNDRPLIRPYKCDVGVESEVKAMFDWIEAQPDLGRVDACVANAGLSIGNCGLMEG